MLVPGEPGPGANWTGAVDCGANSPCAPAGSGAHKALSAAATMAQRKIRHKPRPDMRLFSISIAAISSRDWRRTRFHHIAACGLFGRTERPIISARKGVGSHFGRVALCNNIQGTQVTTVDLATAPVDPEDARPSIGLVLGSGAARGFAHIGVLQVLMAHGIVPDIVVGTSMGALVGGCYATNHLDELEGWARSLTMRRILGYLDVRLGSSGLISGGRLASYLHDSIGSTLIEDLPMRFAAIATEVGTGHEIWLTRGSLALALRASYALPGIFPPVQVGRRWLVDGALVNPVAVSTARAFGARVVIAVNLDADRFGRGATIASHGADPGDGEPADETGNTFKGFARLRNMFGAERALKREMIGNTARPSFSTVMVESFNIMQDRLTRMRLAGDPPDVHITPRIGHIGWLDFHRAAEAIEVGRSAAAKALDSISEMVAALR
jgi:NTE family protein